MRLQDIPYVLKGETSSLHHAHHHGHSWQPVTTGYVSSIVC